MGKYILGLHAGHNASACIGDQTGLLYAIQEERLNGEKNYWGFPKLAIADCLRQVEASASDLAAVAYGSRIVLCRYHSREEVIAAYKRQETVAGQLRQRLVMPVMLALRPKYGQDELAALLADLGLGSVPLTYHDHHLTHAATAYYGLRATPSEKYLVLTCDGVGDGVSASVRVFGGGEVKKVATTSWENSLERSTLGSLMRLALCLWSTSTS